MASAERTLVYKEEPVVRLVANIRDFKPLHTSDKIKIAVGEGGPVVAMARFLLLRSCLLFFLVASMCFVEVSLAGGEGSLRPDQCAAACDYRCSETSHKKPCLFFCNKCCAKCLCVPSGKYGHKEECPCYNNWKTKEGKPKCP